MTSRHEPSAQAGSAKEFLAFRLGREEYAIDILKVQEIRGYSEATRLANMPAFIKGVINLRGVIVPIVDLRMKFKLAQASYDARTVTIVLNIGSRVIGAVVDAVSDVIELKTGQVKAAPDFGGAVGAGHVTGIGSVKIGDAERMLILLDIDAVMSNGDVGPVAQASPRGLTREDSGQTS